MPPYGQKFKKSDRIVALNVLYKQSRYSKNENLNFASGIRNFGQKTMRASIKPGLDQTSNIQTGIFDASLANEIQQEQ